MDLGGECVFALGGPVNAQVVTSNLQGFVTDTSGAIVPEPR